EARIPCLDQDIYERVDDLLEATLEPLLQRLPSCRSGIALDRPNAVLVREEDLEVAALKLARKCEPFAQNDGRRLERRARHRAQLEHDVGDANGRGNDGGIGAGTGVHVEE